MIGDKTIRLFNKSLTLKVIIDYWPKIFGLYLGNLNTWNWPILSTLVFWAKI